MNIKEIEGKLRSFGIEDARGESYLIAEKLFGVTRGALLLNLTRNFESDELDAVLEKRKERIPLQYIFGEWEFMGKKFLVSEACLIPQPDTEILVEKALEILKKRHPVDENNAKCKMQNTKLTIPPSALPTPPLLKEAEKCKMQNAKLALPQSPAVTAPSEKEQLGCDEQNAELQVADLCTGSGCIGLSLLMYGGIDRVMLMDLSKGALDMAKKNAELHGLTDRCELILGDITREMPKKRYDMIVSNPPYIPSGDIDALPEEVKKEPLMALDGGQDGLDIIRFLIGDGLSYLKENGVMLIEFGYDQGEIMDTLLSEKRDTGSIKSYEILKDYGNNPRVAVIWAN